MGRDDNGMSLRPFENRSWALVKVQVGIQLGQKLVLWNLFQTKPDEYRIRRKVKLYHASSVSHFFQIGAFFQQHTQRHDCDGGQGHSLEKSLALLRQGEHPDYGLFFEPYERGYHGQALLRIAMVEIGAKETHF